LQSSTMDASKTSPATGSENRVKRVRHPSRLFAYFSLYAFFLRLAKRAFPVLAARAEVISSLSRIFFLLFFLLGRLCPLQFISVSVSLDPSNLCCSLLVPLLPTSELLTVTCCLRGEGNSTICALANFPLFFLDS